MASVFFLVAFLAAGLFGAAQPATGIPTEIIQLTQFGPALGVAVLALCWPRRTRDLLAGAFRVRVGAGRGPGGAGRGLLMVATAPLIIGLCVAVYAAVTGDARFTRPSALDNPFLVIVVAQLVGACAEEIGWRCLLQPLLRTRFGPLASSVVVGVLWGVWHLPVFAEGPGYAGGFVLAAVSMSVVMGLALERVRANRLLLAGGFHTLINLGMLLFMDEESGAVVPMVMLGASCLAAALVWALATASIHRMSGHAR
ncbi:type II CAAX endopeptidase family protein [Micromonospora sp. NPDC049559]|uniref:type II CAAX endopeptidase family protein n=1 Tax=Micromonospora sp. NPDC049559 TaxID=3155923 RepID=UPI003413F104